MFKFFKKKDEIKNIQDISEKLKYLQESFIKVSRDLENLKKENVSDIKKVGIVRFNPFKDTGGNQSFSLAFLDGKDNGIVITSLYTREGNRVYGKSIKNGGSEFPLSKEEQKAIEMARFKDVNKNKNNKK